MDKQGVQMGVRGAQGGQELRGGVLPHGSSGYFPVPGATPESERPRQPTFYPLPRQPGVASMAPASDFKRPLPPQGAQDSNVGKDKQLEVTSHGSAVASMQGINTAPNSQGRNTTSNMLEMKAMARLRNTANPLTVAKLEQLQQFNQVSGADNTSEQKQLMHHLSMMMQSEQQQLPQQMQQQLKQQLQLQRMQQPTQNPQQHLQQQQWRPQQQQFLLPTSLQQSLSHQQQQQLLPSHQHLQQQPPLSPHTSLMSPHQQDQLSPHQQQLSPHHSPHQSPSPHQQVVSPHQLPHQPQQQLPQQGAQFPNPQQQLMPPPSQQPQHKQMLHLHLLGKQQMMQQRQPPSPQQQQAPPQRMLVRQQVPRQPQPSPLPQDLMTAQQQLHLLQDKMKQEQQQQLLYHKNLEQQCLMQSQQQKQLQHNQQLLQQPQQQQQNQQQQQQQQYVWLNQQQQQQPKMLTDHLDGGVYPPNSGITGLPSLSNPMGGMSALPSRNHTGTSQSVTVMGPPRSVQEGPKLSQQQQFVPMEIGNGVTANASHGNIRLHLHKQAGGSWKAKEVPRNGELPTREKAVAKIILGELMAGSPPQGSAMPKVAAETGLLPLQGCSDGNGQSFESEANPANIDKMAAEYPEYTRLLQMHIGATRVQADTLEAVMEEKVQAKPGRKRKQPAQVEGKVKKPRGRPAKNKQGVIEEMPGVEENNSAMYGRQMPPGHQNNGAISSYMNGRNDVTSSTSVHVPFASGPHMYSTHPSSSGSLGTGMEQFSQNQSIAQTFPTGSSAFSGHSSFPQEGSNLQQAVSCSTTAVYSMSPPITRDSVSCNNSIGQKWTPGGNAMVSLPSDCDKTLFGCNVNNADLTQMISGTPAQTGHGYTRADTSSQSLPRNHPSGQDLKLQDGRPAVRNPSANKAAVSHLSRLQASIDSIEPTNQKEECSVKIEGDNTSYRARELTEEEKMAHLKKVIEDVAAGNFDYEPPSRELHHTGKSPSSTPKSGASPYHTPANTPSSLPPIASFQSPSPSSQVETDEASSSSWSHNPHLQSQIADLSNSMELRHAMDSFISTNMLDVPPPPYRPPPQGWNISYEDSESTSSVSTFNPDVTPMAFPDNLTGYHCETNSNKDEQSISMLKKAEELHQRLTENTDEVPDCCCLGPGKSHDESTEGMYYTQLGSAGSVPALREMLEKRLEVTGKGIRIEVIHHTKVDGKSSTGCPLAKWVIRRVDEEEKYLCLAKKRPGHSCEHAFIIVILVAWEGLERKQADELYSYLVPTLTKNGITTERRCGTNHKRSCACQGVRPEQMGASFSFGCAFSTYSNACKFSRSKVAQKFKLNDEKDKKEELKLEALLRAYATSAGPVQRKVAPDAFRNMTYFSEEASACRLGLDPEKSPFAGVTACMDFCAHAHRDIINMENGCTVVATLTKHRGLSKADDEQLHVLPHYILDPGGETGDVSTYKEKIRTGALEVYQKFPVKTWIRSHPFIPASRLLKEKMLRKKHEKANLTPKKDGRRRNKTDKELTPEEMDNMDPYELNSSDPDPPLTLKGLKTLQHLPGFADFEQQYMQYRQQMQTWPRVSFLLQWLETQDSGTKNQAAHLTGGWAQAQPSTFSQPQPSTSQGQLTASLWPSLGYSPFAGTCPSSVGNSPAKPVRAPDGPGIVWRETHDNREVLMNSKMGGVAVALGHGSLLFEVARKELHATTPLKNPDRYNPTRISLVLYQHKKLNAANHGNRLWKAKLEKKKREREAKAAMAAGMMMAPVSKEVPRQPEDADIWQMCDDPGKAAERESKPELINTALMRWYNTKMEPKKEKEVVKLEEVLPPSAMLYRNMIHIPVSQASFVETYSPPTCRYIGAPPNVTGAFQFWHFTKNPRDPQQVFF